MGDMLPQENQTNGNGAGGGAGGGATLMLTSSETVGAKRQRRPSVRLGDQVYDTVSRRTKHHWRQQKDPNKSSKTRALTNLQEIPDEEGRKDSNLIGSWRVKDPKKRGSGGAKRIRSNWASKIDVENVGDEKQSGGDGGMGDDFRHFEVENSDSGFKEQSPVHSFDNLGDDGHGNGREMVFRRQISNREHSNHDGVEFSGPSDNDVRDWRSGSERRERYGEDGVKIWLSGLGLGRYAPLFEIHEVDDEVLPLLTLEDLKDMGINAVGSRRKMFCAIQKLGKGFS